MLVPQALQAGVVAATNAVLGPTLPLEDEVREVLGRVSPRYGRGCETGGALSFHVSFHFTPPGFGSREMK